MNSKNIKKEPNFLKDIFLPAIIACLIANLSISLVELTGFVSFNDGSEFFVAVLLGFVVLRLRTHYINSKPTKNK